MVGVDLNRSHSEYSSTFEEGLSSVSSTSVSDSPQSDEHCPQKMENQVNNDLNRVDSTSVCPDGTNATDKLNGKFESLENTKCQSNGDSGSTVTRSKRKEEPSEQKQATKKAKRRNKALADLLEASEWYMSMSRGKERKSSEAIEKIKENMIQSGVYRFKKTKVLTPEEKRRRKEKLEQSMMRKKELKRQQAIERAKRRALNAGKNNEKKPPKKEDYYHGNEVEQLLHATAYFTHVGNDNFDATKRREVKPVKRWYPVLDEVRQKRSTRRLKTLKRKKTLKEKKLIHKAAKKPKGTTKSEHKEKIQTSLKKEEEEKEARNIKQEEKKEEAVWFSDLTNEAFLEIGNRKMFVDSIYRFEPDSDIPTGLLQAKNLVENDKASYNMDDPNFPPTELELQYPFSDYTEHYLLAESKKDTAFNVFDELGRHMELLAFTFMPPDVREKVVNMKQPKDCVIGRYITSFDNEDIHGILDSVNEFNALMKDLRERGVTMRYTAGRSNFPIVTIYELLDMCYARAVMPDSRKLRSYKAFSNYVYGELMPQLLSKVYKQCGLSKDSCFMDLGSGVANCVIQAAVEFGCESYGVEIAKNASDLGDKQAAEFCKRCKVMGLTHGPVHLFSRQSFEDNMDVKKVVDRCDVILVNNYLFDAKLNSKVVELFSDLKVGTKIISLKPIVPAGFTVTWNNASSILSRLKTSRYIYDVNSVSWTSTGGFYYISEVMSDIVDDNFVLFQSRSRRHHQFGDEERSRSSTPLNIFTNNV
ncbi:hypothetical protein HII12_002008 [Brettanomyces bruxellensis]|uniref:Histone-lysine N-methyltransferase, H3 lysine-79 specific n=1 Tax=Dekkera bruxellensis TaxID=5007 RepID=A0A8H6BK22_DEKBR|nr:hypothetical protein HII12_002008 [Brettanomyces bruxellensis]